MTDSDEIRRVIDQQHHRVYRVAYYTLASHQDAEDATQEVLTRYWRNAARVDRDHVVGWLVRVTTNVCRDLLRKRASRRESDGDESAAEALRSAPSGEPRPEQLAEQAEALAEVERELLRLDEPFRSLLILRDLEGLSYQEIGSALEMPLTRVRVYLHRGRRRLALRLERSADLSAPQEETKVACPHEA